MTRGFKRLAFTLTLAVGVMNVSLGAASAAAGDKLTTFDNYLYLGASNGAAPSLFNGTPALSFSVGANGSSYGQTVAGDFGGVNYAQLVSFLVPQTPNGGSYDIAALGGSYTTNASTSFDARLVGLSPTLPSFVANAATYQTLTTSTVLTGGFPSQPNLPSALASATGSFASASPVYVTFAVTGGTLGLGGGAGVPAPVAGLGLPLLAGAGLLALRRRRRQSSPAA